MAQQSHTPDFTDISVSSKDDSRPCRMTIFIMQFFRTLFSKNTLSLLNLSKEVVIAGIIIISPVVYPNTAHAGIFSFMSDIVGDKASASTPLAPERSNSQNMAVLKAVVNSNPSPLINELPPILVSENALVAEIGPAGTLSDVDVPSNTEISLYIVRPGDTLSEIAEMFDVSVNTIIWANNITRGAVLKEGQTLIILPITGIRHVVKKGETINSIVVKYKADLSEVLQYNGISLNTPIIEGATVIIPDAEPTVAVKVSPSQNTSYEGYYMRPISGGKKSQGIHGNNGIDLAAQIGTPIYAAAGGTVIASISNGNWNGGYGNYVIISHPNGTQTLYAHNLSNTVSVGRKVSKGDVIARIGMTGKTTGPHVHFEIRGARNPF